MTPDPGHTPVALDIEGAVARAAVAARAGAAREQRAVRQLATLANTYPGWDIDRHRDEVGREWWAAVLRRPVTVEMRAAGVAATIRQPDAITLASTLAWQTAVVHRFP